MSISVRESIEEQVLELVRCRCEHSVRENEDTEITAETDIRADLGFDSIMLVVLQIDIEDTFHIRFDPMEDDFQLIFTTVRALCDYVQRRLEE